MFRIRQILDSTLPLDGRELREVQEVLRERFPGLSAAEIDGLPERLRDPLAKRLRTTLLVADDLKGRLGGFALLSYASDVKFWILDYLATSMRRAGGGIGGALYARVRDAARTPGSLGLFYECLPDDPAACSDPASAIENAKRLRFYEQFGARPIVNTGYETPLNPGDKDLPHLVYDDLGAGRPLTKRVARKVVRAFLERKYGELCSPEYNAKVLDSIVDDPVQLRAPRHVARRGKEPVVPLSIERKIVLVVNDRHEIHHVRDKGYVEAPVRVAAILKELDPSGLFLRVKARAHPDSLLLEVHDPNFVRFVKRACLGVRGSKPNYPYVFPIRNNTRAPKDDAYAAGYWCIDTFTPLDANAYRAARRAVDCALTAADHVLGGQRIAYALVRPPGHHAESRVFGGFCYFCNGAIAAQRLSHHGKVAILDVDYHHGNGQQEIFWRRDDVLTVSIHGHPRFAYPFFTGFEDERGADAGEGFNVNIPLPEDVDGPRHLRAIDVALRRIRKFAPRFLVVSLGADTGRSDPTGTWSLGVDDFERMGQRIGTLGLPTVVVQEGGYLTRSLGRNVLAFFRGLSSTPTA